LECLVSACRGRHGAEFGDTAGAGRDARSRLRVDLARRHHFGSVRGVECPAAAVAAATTGFSPWLCLANAIRRAIRGVGTGGPRSGSTAVAGPIAPVRASPTRSSSAASDRGTGAGATAAAGSGGRLERRSAARALPRAPLGAIDAGGRDQHPGRGSTASTRWHSGRCATSSNSTSSTPNLKRSGCTSRRSRRGTRC
jgi:hypothetical protein